MFTLLHFLLLRIPHVLQTPFAIPFLCSTSWILSFSSRISYEFLTSPRWYFWTRNRERKRTEHDGWDMMKSRFSPFLHFFWSLYMSCMFGLLWKHSKLKSHTQPCERNVKQRWTDTLHIYELAHVVTSFNKQTCGCQVRTNRTLPTCLEPDQPCCKIGPDGWRLSDKNMISSWDWQCAQDFVPQQSFVQGAGVLLCGERAALRVPAANSLRNVPDNLH